MISTFFKRLGLAASLACLASAASATIIDFGDLAGGNGTALGTYNEDGFSVTDASDTWRQGTVFGKPTPSVFTAGPGNNVIVITVFGGGLFAFSSADVGCGTAGTDCGVRYVGTRGATKIFDTTTSVLAGSGDGVFRTVTSPSGEAIDSLSLVQFANDSNFDNISLRSVDLAVIPLPATGLLVVGGLAGLAALRRRKPT